MSNLTTVGLTGGLGTSGTGTISTLDNLIGVAGTASPQVLTVQGIASGTAQPVSGTVTANAGTNLNTSTLALETGGNLATIAGTVASSKVNVNVSSGTVTANAGTNLNTSTLALETGGNLATIAGAVSSAKMNVNISSGAIPTGTNTIGSVKVTDGTNTSAVKAASTAPAATDPALVVAISPNSVNANGLATPANSAPVVQAPTTTAVAVTPTVTASAYTAGNVIGGIMTFSTILDSVSNRGILHSITAKFKGTAVTGNLTVNLFKASPSNGTYTDKSAATWNAADMANMIGSYVLSTPVSNLGTMTIYNLDAIGKAIQGSSQSLFVVATVAGTPTPASTSDFTLELGVLPG